MHVIHFIPRFCPQNPAPPPTGHQGPAQSAVHRIWLRALDEKASKQGLATRSIMLASVKKGNGIGLLSENRVQNVGVLSPL